VVTWRRTPAGHPARLAAHGAVAFIIVEALIGAALVLLGLVADDRRPLRAVVLGVHLTNTFLLLATIALAARWLAAATPPVWRPGARGALLRGGLALVGIVAVGVTGGVTALGDTLFPAASLREGFAADLSPTAHVLVRLRVWHPVLAVVVGLALWAYAEAVRRQTGDAARRMARAVEGLVALQLAVGTVNLVLLAPVTMQLIHLLVADALWVALVLLVAESVERGAVSSTVPAGAPAAALGAAQP
jgi:heme A synthase